MKPTLLIDCSFLCYRAKYTLFKVDNEIPNGIIIGFFKDLQTLAGTFNTDRFMFFWDSKKSKRKEIYPEYKFKRTEQREEKTPAEKANDRRAYDQFDILRKEILKQVGFKNVYLQKGYESDDLIGRYVKATEKETIIISRDNDFFQLLHLCKMYDMTSGKLYDKDLFEQMFVVHPKKWKYVKAIAGCKSDNVVGVQGIGETRAIQYLIKSMKQTSKYYQNIKKQSELIERNMELVSLPYPGTKLVKYKKHEFSAKKLKRILKEHGVILDKRDRSFWQLFEDGML